MQLTDTFCYVLFTITMTATCIQAEGRRHELEERKADRRLSRRETNLLIDSYPVSTRSLHNPKVLYRKISNQRYGPPKPKYGPTRQKNSVLNTSRKPYKKYRSNVTPKHTIKPKVHKKRPQKPRHGPPRRPLSKPEYGSSNNKKNAHSFQTNKFQPKPMGFGEPPSNFDDYRSPKPEYDYFQKPGYEDFQKPDFNEFHKPSFSEIQKPKFSAFIKPSSSDFHKPGSKEFHDSSFVTYGQPIFDEFLQKQGYGEPPVDSYGAPIKSNLHDLTQPTAHSFADTASHLDFDVLDSNFQTWQSYPKDENVDNKHTFSKTIPSYMQPNEDIFVTPVAEDAEEEQGLNSYSDIYNYRQMHDKIKKKPSFQNVKIMNHPWKGTHYKKQNTDDEIIVGGQYAEPPARYVPKYQPNPAMYPDDDEFAPLGHISDPGVVASATNSPYLNYKNSNMAFNPQNLNDAFSLLDK